MEAALLVAWPVVMGLAAVGVVLWIKTRRRVQGTRDPRYTDAAPVNPMAPEHARRLRRRYRVVAGVVLSAVVAAVLMLAAGR